MRKTTTTLADGRELIYFDEDGRPERRARDLRDLPAVEHGSELRFDRLTSSWVTIASHRQERIYLPAHDACPFCPSSPTNLSEIPESSYDVVVFENRFPSFSGLGATAPTPATEELTLPAVGRCEVICFTDDHDSTFGALQATRIKLVLDAWTERTEVLLARAGVAQVYCFENRGAEIGVTEHHPHGQIYAYPYITPRSMKALEAVRRHRVAHSENLFDLILLEEQEASPRVVIAGTHWTAFVPRAARWPFEAHLYPNRRMPYISGWHQAPHGHEDEFALHLEIFSIRRAADKLKYLAGSESGMDAFVSDVSPESAAARLRDS